MSTFNLLSQEKRDELSGLLPDIDTHYSNQENYVDYPSQPSFLSCKNENPVFWNVLTDWQSMLGHGEYLSQLDSPLPLSPSPPTTTNHSTSNKSTSTISTTQSYSRRTKSSSSSSPSSKEKYKDEGFESYWGELIDKERAHNVAG